MKKTPRVLIIAGSDSGGGAGIQADIKTVTMLGGHATTAVTAITAQNTLGVDAVMPVPAEMVLAQIDAVMRDIGADAVKIGMIGSPETAQAVAERLERHQALLKLQNPLGAIPVVFDPVMLATSGAVLADEATIAAFRRLMEIASITTPNVPELAALTGRAVNSGDDVSKVGGDLARDYRSYVLGKGGHLPGETVIDRLFDPDGRERHTVGTRIHGRNTHGTGCTLASAIATLMAYGAGEAGAVDGAQSFVRLAMQEAPELGGGHGPMGHQQVRLDLGPGPRLNQVSLPASDLAATRDFYRQLGLTLIVDSATNQYLRFEAPGGATLSLYPGGDGVHFECENVDREVARLQKLGIVFDELPQDRPWGWRQAWLRDPNGNRICLFTAGAYRRFPPWRISTDA